MKHMTEDVIDKVSGVAEIEQNIVTTSEFDSVKARIGARGGWE